MLYKSFKNAYIYKKVPSSPYKRKIIYFYLADSENMSVGDISVYIEDPSTVKVKHMLKIVRIKFFTQILDPRVRGSRSGNSV